MLQPAYDGIWASPTKVTAVYMNGIVRTIELPPKHLWPELEKQAMEAERKHLAEQKRKQQELMMRQQQQQQDQAQAQAHGEEKGGEEKERDSQEK